MGRKDSEVLGGNIRHLPSDNHDSKEMEIENEDKERRGNPCEPEWLEIVGHSSIMAE